MPLIILIIKMGTAMPNHSNYLKGLPPCKVEKWCRVSEIALQFQEVKFIGINLHIN